MSFRYSTKTFLLAVALVAVSCAALVSPGPMWAAGIYSMALLAMLAASVAAIVCRGETRAFWVGFAIVGGAWMYMQSLDDRGLRGGLWEPRLLTSHLFVRAYEYVGTLIPSKPTDFSRIETGTMQRGDSPFQIPGYAQHFIRTGNSLMTLVLGYLGGLWGRRCYARWAKVDEIE